MMSSLRSLRFKFQRAAFHLLFKRPSDPKELNHMQEYFIQWNAERLKISEQESKKRYLKSWHAMTGGHAGPYFRFFCELSHDTYRVFFEDSQDELYDAYAHHGPMHLLRLLTLGSIQGDVENLMIEGMSDEKDVTILDFGCGIAKRTWWLAEQLKSEGKSPNIVLVDISTIRKDFLLWIGRKLEIPVTFLECTVERPIPEMPPCNLCIATEVFEHVHDPRRYFNKLNEVILPGGFLRTHVADHSSEYMHVSPDLKSVRDGLNERGYTELRAKILFQKPKG